MFSLVATAEQKVDESTSSSKPLTEQAGDAAQKVQDTAIETTSNLQAKTKDGVEAATKDLEDLKMKSGGYVKAGANEVGKAAETVAGR